MWMVSTVVFFIFSWYRLPAVPALILIGSSAIGSAWSSWHKNRKQGLVVMAIVGLAWIAPLFMDYQPNQALVYYNLALVYEKAGNTALAVQNYMKAYAINPRDFLSCINLGNIYAKEKHWDEALAWYKKAEAIEPEAEGIHADMGEFYIAKGKYDEAEKALDRALEINAGNIEALHNKAVLLAMKKQFQEALIINKRVLEMDPDWPPAIRFRERLERLLKKE